MNEYTVEVNQINKAWVTVTAKDAQHAIDLVEDLYSECNISYDELDHTLNVVTN